jgi:hypothetical protein
MEIRKLPVPHLPVGLLAHFSPQPFVTFGTGNSSPLCSLQTFRLCRFRPPLFALPPLVFG